MITNIDLKKNTITFVECSEKEGKVISSTMSLENCAKEFNQVHIMEHYYNDIKNWM